MYLIIVDYSGVTTTKPDVVSGTSSNVVYSKNSRSFSLSRNCKLLSMYDFEKKNKHFCMCCTAIHSSIVILLFFMHQ